LGQYGRNRTNVWEFRRVNSHSSKAEEVDLQLHPTPKPAMLVAEAILDCTARGEIVLDPFLGSGTVIQWADRIMKRIDTVCGQADEVALRSERGDI
jgi:DNA modification methylase